MLRYRRNNRSRAFTMVEIMVVMGLSIMLFIAVYRLFIQSYNIFKYSEDEINSQNAARLVLERIKTDLRAAVFPDGLVGDKFIIQDPIKVGEKETGGSRIRFAKFIGTGEDGKPKIEKILYIFDQANGKVYRCNWSGKWEQKNDSVENQRLVYSLSSKPNDANGSYLYFNTFYTDTDREGFKGRLYVYVGLKSSYGNDPKIAPHQTKMHVVVGPRFITSKDREPFWNINPMSKLVVEDFHR